MDAWMDGQAGRDKDRRTESSYTGQPVSLYDISFSNVIFWLFILKMEALSSSEALVLPARLHYAALQKTPM